VRRATVICEVEIEVDLYDLGEYEDEADEGQDVWKEANDRLARAGALLAVKGYTVNASAAGREDGEPSVRLAGQGD
jgi:hypothetical protein